MQSADRAEFDKHAAVLFAGCNLPATAERIEAFWRGLQEMPLGAFVRVVEHVLGEHGPENLQKISPQQLWQLHRRLRARIEHSQRMANKKTDGTTQATFTCGISDSLRMTMPRTRNGYVVHPDYLPASQRTEYAEKWNAWADEHPGVVDKVAV